MLYTIQHGRAEAVPSPHTRTCRTVCSRSGPLKTQLGSNMMPATQCYATSANIRNEKTYFLTFSLANPRGNAEAVLKKKKKKRAVYLQIYRSTLRILHY
jgi:hypothetical protein